MSKTITRKYIQRITKREGNTSIRQSGGGGGGGGGASQYWVEDNYVSKLFFNRLFTVLDEDGNPIEPNDTETVIESIQSMFGFWTNAYLSALGQNPEGGEVALTLASLADVDVSTVSNGDALVWNAAIRKWVPGQGGMDLTAMWAALGSSSAHQIDASHLSTALVGYATQTWVGNNYLSQTDAATTYISKTDASNTYPIMSFNGTTQLTTGDTCDLTSVGTYYTAGKAVSASLTNPPFTGTNFRLWHFLTGQTGYPAQLAISFREGMAMRGKNNTTWYDWKYFAFKDDNVASATKLQTARTLWGQSFDGTADVSGDMTGVGAVSASGDNIITKSSGGTKFAVVNNYGSVELLTYTNRGVYDRTNEKWLVGTNGTNTWMACGNVAIASSANTTYKLYVDGTVGITGTTTLTGLLTANGGITIPSGKTLTIGDAVLSWDSTNQGIKITKGLYSETFISALGTGGSGGSGVDMNTVWTALANNTNEQINVSHLTNALLPYATQEWVTQQIPSVVDAYTKTESDNRYYALYGGKNLSPSSTNPVNIDTLITAGNYYCLNSTNVQYVSTLPSGITKEFRLWVGTFWTGTRYIYQRIQQFSSNNVYERYSSASTTSWSDWYLVQDNLVNYVKDSELTSTLSGYALTSQLSNYLSLTGGTMANTNLVENLNADLLDGFESNSFLKKLYTTKKPNTVNWYRVADITSYGFTALLSIGESYNSKSPTSSVFAINMGYTNATITQIDRACVTPQQIDGVRVVRYANGKFYIDVHYNNGASTSGNNERINITNLCNDNTIGSISLIDWTPITTLGEGEVVVDEASVSQTINVDTAAKLQTSRTLWGQSFDGSADVSGTITVGNGNIVLNNNKYLYFKDTNGSNIDVLRLNSSNGVVLGNGTKGIDGSITYITSGSGGIQFRVSNTTAKMFIGSDGNVGIGTTSPSYKLSVSGDVSASNFRGALIGNADSATTAAACTGNAASATKLKTSRTIWGQSFNGTGNVSGAMSGVTSIDSLLYFDTTNNRIGVNTSSPADGVHLEKKNVLLQNTSSNDGIWVELKGVSYDWGIATGSGDVNRGIIDFGGAGWMLYFDASNTYCEYGNFICSGGVTSLSDARHKRIVSNTDITIEQIARMRSVKFLWNDGRDDDAIHVGSIAQDWQRILPEVVIRKDDKDGTLSLNYGVAALVSVITTARKVVDHERRIKELEKENERLRFEVKQLKIA